MITPIIRTAITALRRDRVSLVLSFVVPIAFFSIFAVIFGGQHDSVPRVKVIVVDEDQSRVSQQLVKGLESDGSMIVSTSPAPTKNQPSPPSYTAATAEDAVKAGDVSVALIVPHGWGENPISFGPDPAQAAPPIQLLNDASDTIAPQMVSGLLQKAAMTAMPEAMAEQGMKYTDKYIGGFTPEQRKTMDGYLDRLRQLDNAQATGSNASRSARRLAAGIISVQTRSVVGENKNNPMVAFYAAAIGVMFLLFTASGSSGALLDEAESGTIDRVLSSRITMTGLLAGKLVFNIMLAFTQLTVMFLWAWAVFKLDFFPHLAGFAIMGLSTAFAVAAFGMLLASLCRTRAQLGALSTLFILVMSAIGGSMFPRFLMPAAMQKAGLFTINAWAIDGFTKVFWRDLPITALWPQVSVLLAIGIVLFAIARRIASRWEYAVSVQSSPLNGHQGEITCHEQEELELKDRLSLIENMIAQGRRNTESWGWVFVLWGVAYYIAIAWSVLGTPSVAWSVTMMAAMILTFGLISWRAARHRPKSQPPTTLGRAVTSVWIAIGISFIVLMPVLAIGGLTTSKLVIAIIGTLLGTANGASSMILKWKLQFACALVWWALAIIACLGTERQSFIALLIALFFCQIVFGIYCMIREAQERRSVTAHA